VAVFVSILVFSFIVIAIYVGSHKLSGLQTFAVLITFLVGVALVVSPTLASRVAQFLGVGRGSDVILYFCVVAGLFVVANFYFRMKAQEEQIVTMSREIALMAPRLPNEVQTGAASEADQPPPGAPSSAENGATSSLKRS
jgi:hypothetical protein